MNEYKFQFFKFHGATQHQVSCRAPREGRSSSEEEETYQQSIEGDESENLTLCLSNDDDIDKSGSEEVTSSGPPALDLALTLRMICLLWSEEVTFLKRKNKCVHIEVMLPLEKKRNLILALTRGLYYFQNSSFL